MMYSALIAIIIVPFIGFVVHCALFSGVEAPPQDFGSGDMFDVIAGRYDLINRVLALRMDVGWRKLMVEHLKESVKGKTDVQLLDVATGTADVALLLSEAMPEATVLGIDPSQKMLDIGREKVRDQGKEGRVTLRRGAVEHLSSILPDATSQFDGATMSFGIRNVPDRQEALCEIHRVLRPGARFCILEFSEPDDEAGTMGFFARLFIRHVVPIVGGILSGAPREYLHLQNSIKDFPSPKEFVQLMEELKCGEGESQTRDQLFQVEELIQMNFGSVQLYISTVKGKSIE